MADNRSAPRVKNGNALAGHSAEAVSDSITRTITGLLELIVSYRGV